MFTIAEIKELIKAVDQSSVSHFELHNEGAKLVIAKNSAMSEEKPLVVPASTEPVAQEPVKQASTEERKTEFSEILSSTVGTFYAATEPGAKPFVAIGDRVEPGTVVCILEAMKLFNEVPAGVSGEIVEVLVKDGDFVEYGQPLFLVKP